jgi:heme oxygenase
LGYAFYLGLLFGGNILKKMIPNKDEHDFFSFENPKQLITEFKNYLDNNVSNHDEFISNVNEVYKLIKEIFDEFY